MTISLFPTHAEESTYVALLCGIEGRLAIETGASISIDILYTRFLLFSRTISALSLLLYVLVGIVPFFRLMIDYLPHKRQSWHHAGPTDIRKAVLRR